MGLHLLKSPQRILHVIHRMRPGGIQTLVMNIYRQINRAELQFDFAVRSTSSEFYDDEITMLGGRIFHHPWSGARPWDISIYTHALEKTIDRYAPFNVIHSHTGLFSGHTLSTAKKAGIPIRIAHSHSVSTGAESNLMRFLWGKLNRRAIQKNATHLLACSKTAGTWLYGENWLSDPRAKILRNGINLFDYNSLDDKSFLRKKLHLPPKGLLIGHIGRFDHVKNHKFLIEFFLKTFKSYPSSHLVLVGEGPLRSEIEHMVNANNLTNHVHFLGPRSDIPQILGAIDLFVLPSHSEGLGIVLIEAQAAGTPCLASDTVPDEVNLNIGLIQFENLQNSIDQWMEKATTLINQTCPTWLTREKALKENGYDLNSSIDQLLTIYSNQLVQRH